jgi:hypothetical protein
MNYSIEIINNNIIKLTESKTDDNYEVVIDEKNIIVIYNCIINEKILKLEIYVNNIEINKNEIDISDIKNIKSVMIDFNKTNKIYSNIKLTKSMKKYLFSFNEREKHNKLIDICLYQNYKSKSKRDDKYNKLINIITCNEIFSIFRNVDINEQSNLFLFIYKVILQSIINNLFQQFFIFELERK